MRRDHDLCAVFCGFICSLALPVSRESVSVRINIQPGFVKSGIWKGQYAKITVG